MSRKLLIIILLTLLAGALCAADGLIQESSAHSVEQTVARLQQGLGKKGIRIFAVVDHQKNAEGAGLKMNEEVVLIFGNPRLGTPLMKSSPMVGVDLPLKILVWQDSGGKVWVAYTDPAHLARRHGISDRGTVVAKMRGTLDQLTDGAIAVDK